MSGFVNMTTEEPPNSTSGFSDDDHDNNSPTNVMGLQGLMRIAYLIIGTIGLLGNGLVVLVIFCFTRMRKKLTNLFIVHQSIIDMLTSIVLLLFTLTTGQYYISGFVGELLCRVWVNSYALWNLFVTSSFNLLALTLERYLGIVHPIQHRIAFTRCKALIMMGICWFIGPLANIYNPLTTRLDEHSKCLALSTWPSLTVRRATGLINILIKFFLPIITMIYCYSRIIYVLTRKASDSNNQSLQVATVQVPDDTQQNKRRQKAKNNVAKTLVIVCGCFIFCWSWNQIFYVIANLGVPVSFDTPFYHFSVITVFSNCCINPFIYMLKYDEFKLALRKLFCRRFGKVGPVTSTDGEHTPGPTQH